MTAAAEPGGCPAWCTHHPVRDGVVVREHHRGDRRRFMTPDFWSIDVYLYKVYEQTALRVDMLGLFNVGDKHDDQAKDLAGLLRKLGHEDIAAAVDELAAIAVAAAEPAGSPA